jgi:hypothetical protein
MEPLSDLLNNKRADPMSRDEVLQLCEEFSRSTPENNWTKKSLYTFYITEALEKELLDPDTFLSCAIASVRTVSDLMIVSIAMRYGANANMYLNTEKIGNAHLIVYTVSTLRAMNVGIQVINVTLTVLRILGSQSVVNAFDQSGGDVNSDFLSTSEQNADQFLVESVSNALNPDHKENVSTSGFAEKSFGNVISGKENSTSVQDWLRSQGLNPLENIDTTIDDLRKISPNLLAQIGTLCDRPDLAYQYVETVTKVAPTANSDGIKKTTSTKVPSLNIALTSRAKTIIKTYDLVEGMDITNIHKGVYIGINKCIEYHSYSCYQHFIEQGQIPTYFTINQLLLNMKFGIRSDNAVLTNLYQRMLLAAIASGSTMDTDQISLLSTISGPIAQQVLQVYEQPLWRKTCTISEGPITDTLKSAAFNR